MNLKHIRAASLAALVASSAVVSTPVFAANDAMIELLKVLRDNGTITDEAFNLLKNSAAADEERTDAKIEETAEKKLASVNTISEKLKWAEKIKLKGDLRLRREAQELDPENGSDSTRERYRIRARLAAEAQVIDNVKVGIGLATGGNGRASARSTNQSLDDNFGTKSIDLDLAYAEWAINNNIKVVGGKFERKDYLWAPTDMLWDGDINPEGVSANFNFDNSLGNSYANVGHWILEEESSLTDDPTLSYLQVGHKFKSGNFFGNVAGIYYNFDNLSDTSGVYSEVNTNSANNFDSLSFSAEVGMKDLFIAGKQVSIFTDYIMNDESGVDEDSGLAIGFKFGDAKVKDRHQWMFKYVNVDLEQDAFISTYPDSDRFGGATGVDSHEFEFQYGLAKNVTLGLDYYDSEIDRPLSDDDEEKLLQIDLVTKF